MTDGVGAMRGLEPRANASVLPLDSVGFEAEADDRWGIGIEPTVPAVAPARLLQVSASPATAKSQRRCPRPMPKIPAFRRSALSVRFIFFAISDSGVRAFECALISRRSSFVHGVP